MSWHEEMKQKRLDNKISQGDLSRWSGISREHLSRIENGRSEPSEQVKQAIEFALDRFSPAYEMTIIFDYVRIRFPTHDVKHVIEDVLKMQSQYFYTLDYAFYGYTKQYVYGSICVMESKAEDERGTLLELKGHGCREFEAVLKAQDRSWFDFFADCFHEQGKFKRLDLAINDLGGILSIPELIDKCKRDECHTMFKSYQSNTSGEMFKNELLDGKIGMGSTLYLGSLKSDIYFCIYEKDYEQYRKEGVPVDGAEIKNRFEIRLKNDRALTAVEDLLCFGDIDKTAFEIINNYAEFVDPVGRIDDDEWEVNPRWAWFMGDGRNKLKLTVKPEPYTFDKSVRWLLKQVIPTLKTALKLDLYYDRNTINDAIKKTEMPEKHKRLLKQLTLPLDDVIVSELTVNGFGKCP